MQEYIHYGTDLFRPDLVLREKHCVSSKPSRGIWASPIRDSAYTWRDFCENEDFRVERLALSFKFFLKEEAKILEIHNMDDILPFVNGRPSIFEETINFKKLYESFDGMELFLSENWRFHDSILFYAWDVDSIVIWNPDIIIPKGESYD